MNREGLLLDMYGAMLDKLGPSNWWPGDTPFEVAVGAILTQNTNWQNVDKAISNLKLSNALEARAMYALPLDELQQLIRPAGYFRVKAVRLRNFLDFLKIEADFDISSLSGRDLPEMRGRLLGVNGIGPETADSILLYALGYPTFVVDAYTARIYSRHGLVPEDVDYSELQGLFMDSLDRDSNLFNEYHALIVRVGKDWCKKKQGLCETCPLSGFLD